MKEYTVDRIENGIAVCISVRQKRRKNEASAFAGAGKAQRSI